MIKILSLSELYSKKYSTVSIAIVYQILLRTVHVQYYTVCLLYYIPRTAYMYSTVHVQYCTICCKSYRAQYMYCTVLYRTTEFFHCVLYCTVQYCCHSLYSILFVQYSKGNTVLVALKMSF